MVRFGTLILAFVLAASLHAEAATKAIKFGKLWDGHRTIANAVVVVQDDKIQSVTANGRIPAGAETIDLSRYTGIPGLIDSHTHMTFYWDRSTGATPLHQPPRHVAVTVFLAQENAKKTLEAGVTTVRDLTGLDGADLALRDLINRGAVAGPRMFVSGPGIRQAAIHRPGVTDYVAEAARLTKSIIDSGADWVKVYGSTGGADDVTGDETITYDEMKAIIDTAHAAGRKVAVHSYGPVGAKDAIRAGTDTLEHATDMDDATIAELIGKKIWYVPTINHNQHYLDRADDVYKFTPAAKENLRNFIQRNFATAQKAYRAGARMLIGSDAVYTAFGLNMHELNWFVKFGMSNEQALQAATILPAEMLGMQTSLGAVAPGYIADMVAVDGDPLADISVVLNNVRWVMKGGAVAMDKTK
ncbi:MAG TPA: amidohydrolase family protein [Micropepsaceae bacterium]|jgi:imidazolonepropionase-like amidohydrolase|nr:amidohydrolase family protein [Micropepsaceae bacterium]